MHLDDLYKQLTNYRTLLAAMCTAALGIASIAIAETVPFFPSWLSALLRDLGSLLVASVAIALLWELFSRRALLAELLAETRLASQIDATGLVGVSAKWQGQVDWPKLFRSTETLDIFFMYGRTWRNTYLEQLQSFAACPSTQLNLVLPDPNDPQVTAELGKRIGVAADEMSKRIIEAHDEFIRIFNQAQSPESKLTVWFAPVAPVFSYYRFDGTAIFTLYKHALEKVEVPTFIVRRGGSLYDFLDTDFAALTGTQRPLAKKVYPTTDLPVSGASA